MSRGKVPGYATGCYRQALVGAEYSQKYNPVNRCSRKPRGIHEEFKLGIHVEWWTRNHVDFTWKFSTWKFASFFPPFFHIFFFSFFSKQFFFSFKSRKVFFICFQFLFKNLNRSFFKFFFIHEVHYSKLILVSKRIKSLSLLFSPYCYCIANYINLVFVLCLIYFVSISSAGKQK